MRTRPLPRSLEPSLTAQGHAGLWYDKFCDEWRIEGDVWTLSTGSGDDNPKQRWMDQLVQRGPVGIAEQLAEADDRIEALVNGRAGRTGLLETVSRFVTGLGRSHPVENGFAWHSTLGTPFLPGSSIKGMICAWARSEAEDDAARARIDTLLGDKKGAGRVAILDALPVRPVDLETDVMTPHYAGWTPDDPPGDWRSPVPIPFLTTAAGAVFRFGLVPVNEVEPDDLDLVWSWLEDALSWEGAGAKTAVGYGRFEPPKTKVPMPPEATEILADIERLTRAYQFNQASHGIVERIRTCGEEHGNEVRAVLATAFRERLEHGNKLAWAESRDWWPVIAGEGT